MSQKKSDSVVVRACRKEERECENVRLYKGMETKVLEFKGASAICYPARGPSSRMFLILAFLGWDLRGRKVYYGPLIAEWITCS